MIDRRRALFRLFMIASLVAALLAGMSVSPRAEAASTASAKSARSAKSQNKRTSTQKSAKKPKVKKGAKSKVSKSRKSRRSVSRRRRRPRRYVAPPMQIPPERVSEIQQALSTRGYYSGAPNGKYDDSTKQAMKRFQSANNLSVTGLPSAKTLKLLGLSSTQAKATPLKTTPVAGAQGSGATVAEKKNPKSPDPEQKPQPKADHPF